MVVSMVDGKVVYSEIEMVVPKASYLAVQSADGMVSKTVAQLAVSSVVSSAAKTV